MSDLMEMESITSIDQFKNIAPQLVEFLIKKIIADDGFEIGTYHQGKKRGSIISFDIYDTDRMLQLILFSKSEIKLQLIFYDFDGNQKDFEYLLDKNDLEIIPPGLMNLMGEVRTKMKPRTIQPNSLEN